MQIETIDIIKQADKFLDVALYCIGPDYNDGFYVGKKISEDELMKKLFPKDKVTAIVNCAFSCELYLKSLLNKGRIVGGHNLEILYSQLDDVWKKIILMLMGYDEDQIIVFTYFLNCSSNAFGKWRYIYEKEDKEKRFYFFFIKKFVFALQKVAYWKYYYEQNCLEKVDEKVLEIILNKK